MKNRDLYLSQLIQYKDKPLIKVITGIRRCGKSTLLSLFKNHLIDTGIPTENIISINFESFEFDRISNYKEMHTYINERLVDKKTKRYILLDEVQMIPSWERTVNSFLVDANVDIYITGSNAYLLSSELSTLLSGRYVEIKMQPLSFKEYLDFIDSNNRDNLQDKFNQYLKFGGLPTVVELMDNPNTIGIDEIVPPVKRFKRFLNESPAIAFNPSAIIFIPNKKKPIPPTTETIATITTPLSFKNINYNTVPLRGCPHLII